MDKPKYLGRLGNMNQSTHWDFDMSKIVRESFPKDELSQGKLRNLEKASKLWVYLFEKGAWNWGLEGSIGFWIELNGNYLQYASNYDLNFEGENLTEHYEKAHEIYQNLVEMIEKGNYQLCFSHECGVKIEPVS